MSRTSVFEGDCSHDLGVDDTATGNWWVKQITAGDTGIVHSAGQNWGGWSTVLPVPGNYTTNRPGDEKAVFDTRDGNWFIDDGGALPSLQWGAPGTTPVPGDFDGDDLTDPAVFDGETGNWFVRSMTGGVIVNGDNWGWTGTQPIVADFNGDNCDDLAVFDINTYRWFIREAISNNVLVAEIWWGYPGTIPFALNFDADPEFELGAYDPNGGRWHVADVPGTTSSNIWIDAAAWGFPGALPAPANYDGSTDVWELGVYHQTTGNWYIRGVNGTTPANWGWPGGNVVPLGAAN